MGNGVKANLISKFKDKTTQNPGSLFLEYKTLYNCNITVYTITILPLYDCDITFYICDITLYDCDIISNYYNISLIQLRYKFIQFAI